MIAIPLIKGHTFPTCMFIPLEVISAWLCYTGYCLTIYFYSKNLKFLYQDF